jgi:hypothetical protein
MNLIRIYPLDKLLCTENALEMESGKTSMVASARETERDLAGRQFPRNCLSYNIIEFQTF